MPENVLKKVDHSALRVNQATIIIVLLAAFVLDLWWLVALTAIVMLLGTLAGRPGFVPLYLGFRRLRAVKPDVLNDNPEPHRFAQGFGGIVAAGAAVSLALGGIAGGWALTWLVIVLASLNLFLGFCAGCAVYYWLSRLQAPGFTKAPPAGTFPGMRPKA